MRLAAAVGRLMVYVDQEKVGALLRLKQKVNKVTTIKLFHFLQTPKRTCAICTVDTRDEV